MSHLAQQRQATIDNYSDPMRQFVKQHSDKILDQITQLYHNFEQPVLWELKNHLFDDDKNILEHDPTLKHLLFYIGYLILANIGDESYLEKLPDTISLIRSTYDIDYNTTMAPDNRYTADDFYWFLKKLPWSALVPFPVNKVILVLLALKIPNHTINSRNPYPELNIGYITPEFNQRLADQEDDNESYNAILDSYENGETHTRICFDEWLPTVRYYSPKDIWVGAPSLIRKG
jgi:hypothetical protein